jgi:hypothetical protein
LKGPKGIYVASFFSPEDQGRGQHDLFISKKGNKKTMAQIKKWALSLTLGRGKDSYTFKYGFEYSGNYVIL